MITLLNIVLLILLLYYAYTYIYYNIIQQNFDQQYVKCNNNFYKSNYYMQVRRI